MEKFFLDFYTEFMHIYFWAYLIVIILISIAMSGEEYSRSKENAIKNGTYLRGNLSIPSIFALVLWIMSWNY